LNIAIIPARGGSKRIPMKNIRNFSGSPIISYSIREAKKSKLFDHVIVSTDNQKIRKIAEKYGAICPFYRPKKLSNDIATLTQVVTHTLKEVSKIYAKPKNFCCIYATSPFIDYLDIKKSYKLFKKNYKKTDMILAVSKFTYPVQRAFRIKKDGNLQMIQKKYLYKRSQDLEEAYHDAAHFFWGKTQSHLKKINTNFKIRPYFLPRYRAQDIDSLEDWKHAEKTFKLHNFLK
tara:strand:+ start:130 stop:825 length:696 start_codon:yes stop_codon:yes gene_type:complete